MRSNLSIAALLLLASAPFLRALEEKLPEQLEGVGVKEKLGATVDLNLEFVNERGQVVRLGSYFNQGRPVVLNLVYYACPMLCNLILNGQTETLRDLAWTPGEQFEVVTISINPGETPELARNKKAMYLETYGKSAPGWHFLTDYQGNVQKLAGQVGFGYRYDTAIEQYAHSAAIMVLSPAGKVTRYLYGIRFKTRDFRLAISEASEGKVGISERLLMFCYHYDPQSRSYVPFAMNFMRAGGALVVLFLGTYLIRFWRRERTRLALPSSGQMVTAK